MQGSITDSLLPEEAELLAVCRCVRNRLSQHRHDQLAQHAEQHAFKVVTEQLHSCISSLYQHEILEKHFIIISGTGFKSISGFRIYPNLAFARSAAVAAAVAVVAVDIFVTRLKYSMHLSLAT